MKRNTKAVVAAFERAFIAKLAASGIMPARQLPWHEETPEFEVETKAGKYTFHHDPQIGPRPLNFIGVKGRFHEPARAKQVVNCNPFSGKWNWEGIGYVPTEDQSAALGASIARQIIRIM
jgi:hypothetical protein